MMHVKYSPIRWNPHAGIDAEPDTEVTVRDANTVVVDGEVYEFDAESVAWDDLSEQTGGVILDARRENGELYVTVRRFYTQLERPGWDTGDYHAIDG